MPEMTLRNVVIAAAAVVVILATVVYTRTHCVDLGLFKTCTVSTPTVVTK